MAKIEEHKKRNAIILPMKVKIKKYKSTRVQAITFQTISTFINRQLSKIDNFHEQTNFINRQHSSIDDFHQKTTCTNRQLLSIDNFHQQTTFSNKKLSSSRRHPQCVRIPHTPESHQSIQLTISYSLSEQHHFWSVL